MDVVSKSSILNVVIGTSSMKIIETYKKDTEVIVKNVEYISSEDSLFFNAQKMNYKLIKSKLRDYVSRNKARGASVCFALSEKLTRNFMFQHQSILKQESLNTMFKEKIVGDLIDNMNIDLEGEKVFDVQILKTENIGVSDDEGNGTTDIFVTVMGKNMLKELKKVCSGLRMQLKIIEPEMSCLARRLGRYTFKGVHTIIDIGAHQTVVYYFDGTNMLDVTQIEFGIEKVDEFYKHLFKCDGKMAEEIRKKKGIDIPNVGHLIKKFMEIEFLFPVMQIVDTILNNETTTEKYIYGTGGGWDVPGIREYFRKETGVNLAKFSPTILKYENENVRNKMEHHMELFASCVGLAERGGI